MQPKDMKPEDAAQPERILARQLGRELDDHELDAVAGASGWGTICPDGARDEYC